ncbi:hypothetical protein AB0C74_10105 [Spirillospora sp. NPDC048832]
MIPIVPRCCSATLASAHRPTVRTSPIPAARIRAATASGEAPGATRTMVSVGASASIAAGTRSRGTRKLPLPFSRTSGIRATVRNVTRRSPIRAVTVRPRTPCAASRGPIATVRPCSASSGSRVDLPEPDGPITAVQVAAGNAMLASASAWTRVSPVP